jgi:hypothetical protein
MSTKTDIVNMALSHIGQKIITSVESGTEEQAKKARLLYDNARDAVLRTRSWNFATKIEPLATISGESIPGWNYLYQRPSKCLLVRKIFAAGGGSNPTAEEHKELLSPTTNVNAIAAQISGAYIEYTMQVVDVSLYDTGFIEALSYKLASMLAQPLTGNKDLGVTMLGIFKQVIDDAGRTNASEGNVKPVSTSSYIDAR